METQERSWGGDGECEKSPFSRQPLHLCVWGMWLESVAGPAASCGNGRGAGGCPRSPKCVACVFQVLLPAAGLLQLQDVKKTCCEFLESQLHPVNCLGIRAFADMHACTDLLNKANTYAGKCHKPQQGLRPAGSKPLRSLWFHSGLWKVSQASGSGRYKIIKSKILEW